VVTISKTAEPPNVASAVDVVGCNQYLWKVVMYLHGLYKGFIATDGKQPKEKYKGLDKFKCYADVVNLPSFAGVLRDDCIMIDIDDADQAEKMMQIVEDLQIRCRVTCTKRGKHFTFRNSGVEKCGTGLTMACGLVADIKTGGMPEVLKVEGEERFCEWGEVDPESGEYDELPLWMHPVTTKLDFTKTDSRNNDFFGYILVLQTQLAMTKDQCRETIKIINDYVLPEPLEDSELSVILRDEAFEKPIFFEGKKFLHDAFANWMINQHYIKRINGQLHIYKDGIYCAGYRNIEFMMLKAYPQMKDNQRKEVLKYIEVMCVENATVADANLIAFKNGIYDITKDTLTAFSPDVVITNQVPWDYNPAAQSEIAAKTLDKMACHDPEIRALLDECIGYCFFRRNELSVSMFLTGEKANGKSTFLQMLQDVLGTQNTSNLGLDELDERFAPVTMFGKLANIGDDISDDFLHGRSIAHFKKIVSGNMVKAEDKGQPLFFYKPFVKLIFSANQIPRMKDRTGAVLRRMVIIPFNATFSKTDPDYDPYIAWKLKDPAVMEYLVKVGVEGLKRILANHSFTQSKKVDAEIKEYTEYNNPVLLFLAETDKDEIINQETKLVHSAYELFCHDNGFQYMGLTSFSKEINRQLECTTISKRINGRKVRIFVK
jgi:putative DNA primase/helicase